MAVYSDELACKMDTEFGLSGVPSLETTVNEEFLVRGGKCPGGV